MNRSEEFVNELCRRSFLSMWSIANPAGKEPGKELCDVLVACDPDVIIFSVKEITHKNTTDVLTGWKRWNSKAIDASAKQIYGAERLLSRLSEVWSADGTRSVRLPPVERRRIHRVAVALGSQGEIPIALGDPSKEFIHALDDISAVLVMREVDTITDFVRFLSQTEALLTTTSVVAEGFESLLAYYLHNGRSYPARPDRLYITAEVWEVVTARPEFERRREADKESYLWDAMIEHLAADNNPDLTYRFGHSDEDGDPLESVARIMAREDRFSRRILAKSFREFHQGREIRSRIVHSPSGVLYVFLAGPRSQDRLARRRELMGRMFIARGMYQDSELVVGIATEEYTGEPGFSFDAAVYQKPEWTASDQEAFLELQSKTGAFQNPRLTESNEDEYPQE